jgi:hypothetical protein
MDTTLLEVNAEQLGDEVTTIKKSLPGFFHSRKRLAFDDSRVERLVAFASIQP